MRRIIGHVRTDRVGSTVQFEFTTEDDATDDEIEEMAREAMFNHIEWGWRDASKPEVE